LKKYLRSMTKVASRVLPDQGYTPKGNPMAAAHREKHKAYAKHWTAHRSKVAHAEAFGLRLRSL
jgi:hypothetical protein